jgi:hypothetical protein
VLDLARTIVLFAGSASEAIFTERPIDDPEVRCPDISRARSLLGWAPDPVGRWPPANDRVGAGDGAGLSRVLCVGPEGFASCCRRRTNSVLRATHGPDRV